MLAIRTLLRLTPVACAALALSAGFLTADSAHAAIDVRSFDEARVVEGQRLVLVDLSVGDLEVEASTGNRLEIDVAVRCSRLSRRCRERAESIELVIDERPSAFEIRFDGYPKHNAGAAPALDVTIIMPESLDLEVEMGVGDVDVVGLRGDVRIDVGVGDVAVEVAEDVVGAISLDVGVGAASIEPTPARSDKSGFLFLGNEVRWDDGPGRSEIEIEVGVGEASVSLE